MKPKLQANLTIDTAAHAVQIRDAIVQQMAGTDIYMDYTLDYQKVEGIGFVGIVEVRFNNVADRDKVANWIQQSVLTHPQIKVWVSQCVIVTHDCPHDEPFTTIEAMTCATRDVVRWSKV